MVYLRGNHDDILDRFLPMQFGGLQIVDRYILESASGRYLIIHGDAFDAVTQNSRLIAILGDIGYQSLLKFNRIYNRYRTWRGKEYFSLSKAIKARTKYVVNYISRFEKQVVLLARRHTCSGFICGHIHTPEDKMIDGIRYLNSGDWVESNTALVEHFDGHFEILPYPEFRKRLQLVMDQAKDDEQRNALHEAFTRAGRSPAPSGTRAGCCSSPPPRYRRCKR